MAWRIYSSASGAAIFAIVAAFLTTFARPVALDKSRSAMISRSMVWTAPAVEPGSRKTTGALSSYFASSIPSSPSFWGDQ